MTFKNEERLHEFVIIIKREPGVSDQEGVQEMNQETNGVTNEVDNGVDNGVTNEVNPVKVSLTGAQKDILNFCSVPRTAKEILERLGLTPNASNQKYRKKKR